MKGAWIMHTLRSVINNDKIWFEILNEFMIENAKGFADTEDFFNKVNEKTGNDYWYFADQYFYSPNQPKLDYYQTNSDFYYRWNNVNEDFKMPIDFLVNGKVKRVYQKVNFNRLKFQNCPQLKLWIGNFMYFQKK